MSTTFYDNTSPLPGAGNTTGFFPGYNVASFSTPGSSLKLTSLALVLSRPAGAGTIKVTIDLYASTGVSPNVAMGALIANLATDASFSANATPALYTIPLAANPVLTASTRYWIAGSDPHNTGASWRYTSPWSSAGTGVINEFNSGSGLISVPDSNVADFFSNNQLSSDPNGTSPPFYWLAAGDPAGNYHFRVLTSASLSPASNNDPDWTLGGVQL